MAQMFMDDLAMDIHQLIAANLGAWMEATPSMNTIRKVSDRSGVGFGTVRRIRNGDGNPTIANLVDIAKAFKRPVQDLIATNGAERRLDYTPPLSPATMAIATRLELMNEREQYRVAMIVEALESDPRPTGSPGVRKTLLDAPTEPGGPEIPDVHSRKAHKRA